MKLSLMYLNSPKSSILGRNCSVYQINKLGLDNPLISVIPALMDKLIGVIIVHKMNLFALIDEGGN